MSWTDRIQPIKVGDEVAYSRQFLKSIGAYTGDMPQAKGKVTALKSISKEVTLAEIAWEGDADLPQRVNVKNLCKVGGIGYGD